MEDYEDDYFDGEGNYIEVGDYFFDGEYYILRTE